MRHLLKGRRLNRNPSHRLALKRNMACQLIAHERIITTDAKAKELRPYVERLITLARKAAVVTGDTPADQAKRLHYRRMLIQRLGGKKYVPLNKDETVNIVDKLMGAVGPRFVDRPGGYTRIMKRSVRRLGDAAPTAMIELLAAGDSGSKPVKKTAPAATSES